MNEREEDILDRGSDLLVYDYNGNIVSLNDAAIWYNSDGDYFQPKAHLSMCKKIMLLIERIFCCFNA